MLEPIPASRAIGTLADHLLKMKKKQNLHFVEVSGFFCTLLMQSARSSVDAVGFGGHVASVLSECLCACIH